MNTTTNRKNLSAVEAVKKIRTGDILMIGGQTNIGVPTETLSALVDSDQSELTLVFNYPGPADGPICQLAAAGRLAHVICSYPRGSSEFIRAYEAGKFTLEVEAQGTLSERIRAGGAGVRAFYTPTGINTSLAEGKQHATIDGVECVLEHALRADVSLIRAHSSDSWGNLVYRGAARNYNPTMATAATTTIAEVDTIVPLGALDPEVIVTPAPYVDHIVCRSGSYE